MTHLWLLLFLNAWLKREAQGFGMNLIQVPDDDRAKIMCTFALLGKYFQSGESLSGSVLHMSITTASVDVQQSILQALHTGGNYPWTIVVKEARRDYDLLATAQFVLHEKPQCYFLVIENIEDEDMDEIFENWKSNLNWNPLAQFVVYLSAVEETEEEMTDIMIEILLNFMNKKIYNVNIIGQSDESSYFYGKTVFPYHPDNNCGNRVISIETLDICEYQEGEKQEAEEEYEEDTEAEEHQDNEVGEGKEQDDIAVHEGEKGEGQEDMENNSPETSNKDIENSPEHEVLETSLPVSKNIHFQTTTSSIVSNLPFEPATPSKLEHLYDETTSTVSNSLYPRTTPSDVEYIADSPIMRYKNLPHTQNANQSVYPKLYIKELYRALFLDKFPKDLSGCPLVAAYRPWEPYIFNEALENTDNLNTSTSVAASNNSSYGEEDDNNDYEVYGEHHDSDTKLDAQKGSEKVRLNGIEYKMIQTIGERLHISIEMQVENTNLYHLFQQLIDGDIEMVVGGIDEDPSISQFVSSTVPYHQDDLTFCVAKAQHTHNLFNFMATFQSDSWILTLVFILTASLNILMSQKFLKLRLGFLKSYFKINVYVMGSILSQAVNLRRPIPTCLKVCFGTTFFMGLMFSNVYQSFLFSTLTTPKSSYQISHLQEIYQNRMHIMGSVDNVRHLNKEGEIYRYVRENFKMCYNIEECLQRTAIDAKLAVTVSRQHSFYNPRIPRDHLFCFDRNENIYVYLVTMLLPKKFHLLHKINPVIQYIIESGHMQKWARDLDMRRKIKEEIQRAREEPFKSLTLAQVGGSFAFSGVLLVFAALVFTWEHLVYWLVVKRKTRLKLAKVFHRKFV